MIIRMKWAYIWLYIQIFGWMKGVSNQGCHFDWENLKEEENTQGEDEYIL